MPKDDKVTPVPKTVFDTDTYAPQDRFKAWRNSMGVIFDCSLDDRTDPCHFHAKLTAAMLGPVFCGRLVSQAQRFERPQSKIIADGLDHLLIQVFRSGSGEVEVRGAQNSVRPGDIYIMDASAPLKAADYEFDNVTMVIPRDIIADRLTRPDEHHKRIISGSNPLAKLLYDYMLSLDQQTGSMSIEEAELAIEPFLSLTESLLNHHALGRRAEVDKLSVDAAMLASIKRFIEENLSNQALSPDMICANLGLSRSRLYRLFETLGGVSNYIRHRRLRRSLRDVVDENQRTVLIKAIAHRWGFRSESDFSRIFKRHYGVSPNDARNARMIHSHAPSDDHQIAEYEQWLRNLAR